VTGDLSVDEFAAFFRYVHAWSEDRGWASADDGRDPFPWQVRLLRDWVAGPKGWPPVLDLPTGSGKTAALDVAVFHLAMEAGKGEGRRAPVRIAFVVDRRLIVDDAYARAKRIEQVLAAAALSPTAPEVLRKVAVRLRHFAECGERPLLARRLRGGVPREDDWARTPSQPTILCSTVDQVGSRLLFRGYGVSDSMKPLHAGLLGSDCLILLDEAHLSEPFLQTVKTVARHRASWRDAQRAPTAPFGVALLTATPGSGSDERFGLQQEDREHPVLRRRLEAAKPARLVSITSKGSTGDNEAQRVAAVHDAVEAALEQLAEEKLPAQPTIGVVVNRVLRARRVFQRLRGIYCPPEDDAPPRADVFLVIGPSREIDREDLATELDPIKTGRDQQRRELSRPRIIVATQTIEAGADLDFDALITEVAALDALKQRFGRLNRSGRPFTAHAAVLAHQEDTRIGKKGDPVYGLKAAETWQALQALAASREGGNQVDFAASSSSGLPWIGELSLEAQGSLSAPKADAPVLMPAYVDLWSQTSPIPTADPEVSLFLHGADRSPATVQIVWRADFDLDRDDFDAKALLTAMPPKPGEMIEVSRTAARRWLQAPVTERAAPDADFADSPDREQDSAAGARGRSAFRWAGPESDRTGLVYARNLRPNDLIVVPDTYGGCDAYGWDPGSEQTAKDVADRAAERFAARRYALRLTPKLIEALASENDDESAAAGASRFAATFVDLMTELRDGRRVGNVSTLISAMLEAEPPPGLGERLGRIAASANRSRPQLIFPYGYDREQCPRGIVLIAPKGIEPLKPEAELEGGTPATEDDWLGSASGAAQTLDEHSCEVRDRAAAFAEKADLGREISCDIALAGYLHDAGKADPRFQTMLYGGDWFAVDDRRILAKSAQRVPTTARAKAGLPDHWRHEALSVRIARVHSRFAEATDPELVLWLIGVHHGYGRPLFPHPDEEPPERLPNVLEGVKAASGPGPQSLAFNFNGWDWPQIFERLKRRYGVWELARLEAIVRLADHRASEAVATRPPERGSR